MHNYMEIISISRRYMHYLNKTLPLISAGQIKELSK